MIRHRKKTIVGGFHNIFKRVYAQTIGADIVPVQPMSEPKGNLFFLDFPYQDASGSTHDVPNNPQNPQHLV